MAGFPLLDLAIGMAFVFLLLSLICSSLSEGFESLVRFRAKDLEEGVRLLLGEHQPVPAWAHIKSSLFSRTKLAGATLTNELYRHPLVRSLYREEHNLPTYIPAGSFALALLDLLKTTPELIQRSTSPPIAPASSANPPGLQKPFEIATAVKGIPVSAGLKSTLETLILAADHDPARIRENVEGWFNSSMDRASGWYKRRVQYILWFFALVVTVLTNADTVEILRRLSQAKNLDAIVTSAVQYQGQHAQAGGKALADAQSAASTLQELDLGIGWAKPSTKTTRLTGPLDESGKPLSIRNALPVWPPDSHLSFGSKFGGYWSWVGALIWMHAVGWTITAAAIALGAPFWFDLLNRFIVVRSTVKPKEKSPDEPPKT